MDFDEIRSSSRANLFFLYFRLIWFILCWNLSSWDSRIHLDISETEMYNFMYCISKNSTVCFVGLSVWRIFNVTQNQINLRPFDSVWYVTSRKELWKSGYILWHADPLLGNKLINTFPQRLFLGNQLDTEHISMDTSDKQTFPSIPIRYIRGCSDQNEVRGPLIREGAPQEQNRNCHTSNKDLVVSPRWVLYSKTDWPADRRS
jgi:hypothetical protein